MHFGKNGSFGKWNNERIETIREEALQRYVDREKTRKHSEKSLEKLIPSAVVDTADRVRVRKSLIDSRDGMALERIIGNSDLFPICYLQAGLDAGKSVCRIAVRDSLGRILGYGTGFLVSSSLILTNNHVLESAATSVNCLAEFNYETDLHHMPRQSISFRLDPERFFITDEQLDFTLVAVEESSTTEAKVADFGCLPLLAEPGKILLGEYVSIIQHPEGGPKSIAIRENEVKDVFDDFVHYATDTEPGSSGSPVFNDGWKVVTLHHSGIPDPKDKTKYVANEGIRVSSIVSFLGKQRASLSNEGKTLLDEAISGLPMPPFEVEKMIVGTLDKEGYGNAPGYDASFLGEGFNVPLPLLKPDMVQDSALTDDGGAILNYTHFSIVMSKSRKLAFYTAVNIDGGNLVNINRSGDKWYFDPRIDKKNQCGPELYENNELDRGHLVRRLDPVWGNSAPQANEETFHFTNCSPQHKNLNQKTWLNLEDYIFKNAGEHDLKVSVFTGPIFRADDLLYRGEFQIPAEFWKMVVMVKDGNTLSATAYLQTQKNLITDLEFAFGQYKTYQVPIAKIEALTGLDFGQLSAHDPIANIESTVGRVIERPENIKL
jgi:endonuclease G